MINVEIGFSLFSQDFFQMKILLKIFQSNLCDAKGIVTRCVMFLLEFNPFYCIFCTKDLLMECEYDCKANKRYGLIKINSDNILFNMFWCEILHVKGISWKIWPEQMDVFARSLTNPTQNLWLRFWFRRRGVTRVKHLPGKLLIRGCKIQ